MTLDHSRIKGICFDIDGTLSDTDDQVVNKLVRWLSPLQLFSGIDKAKLARRLVMAAETPGNALYSIPDRLHLDDELAWLMERMTRWAGKKHHFLLMPGVRDLLQSLIEIYPMVIVTAREPFAADHFLRQFDLHPYFRHVISGQTCVHTKPYPDPILHSAQLLGLQPGDLLMVGDTIVDILSARRAGAQSAGVLCGFGEETELRRAGADLILLTTSDLAQHLLPANHA
jgi:HAD superfamily hydrolase (TIGR01549 family)